MSSDPRRDSPLIEVIDGVVVSIPGEVSINDAAKWMQLRADYEGASVAAVYHGVPIIAMPGGKPEALVRKYLTQATNYMYSEPGLHNLPKLENWLTSEEVSVDNKT